MPAAPLDRGVELGDLCEEEVERELQLVVISAVVFGELRHGGNPDLADEDAVRSELGGYLTQTAEHVVRLGLIAIVFHFLLVFRFAASAKLREDGKLKVNEGALKRMTASLRPNR